MQQLLLHAIFDAHIMRSMISYRPLVRTLGERGLDIKGLAERLGIQSGGLKGNLNKGAYLSLKMIDRICRVLKCGVSEVIEYEEGEQEVGKPEYYCKVNWEILEKRIGCGLGEAGVKAGHSREYYKAMKRRGRMRKNVLRALCEEYGMNEMEVLM